MTTIAYDSKEGVIAADSQETSGSGDKFNCQKLFRVGHLIVATAGGTYSGMAFVRWLSDWKNPDDVNWDDYPDFTNLDTEEDFECLVIRPDKSCFTVNRLFTPVEQHGNRFIALGSGSAAARGAMLAGASPKEAVNIAKQIDAYTGGRVVEMTVQT